MAVGACIVNLRRLFTNSLEYEGRGCGTPRAADLVFEQFVKNFEVCNTASVLGDIVWIDLVMCKHPIALPNISKPQFLELAFTNLNFVQLRA